MSFPNTPSSVYFIVYSFVKSKAEFDMWPAFVRERDIYLFIYIIYK